VIIPGDDFDKILPKNATKNTSPTKLSNEYWLDTNLDKIRENQSY
jgi:hypothetical protein